MTRVRVFFTKSLGLWRTNPVRLHTKRWAFLPSVVIMIGANFLFYLSSRPLLHFKNQVSQAFTEVDLRLFFTRVSRTQYIDTLPWFNVLFTRDERTVNFFSPRVQSWCNKIESNPVLIHKIFENRQSDPVLIRRCKIMYFYFVSWGKSTTGAILPLAKYDWLKAK